jgi:hypothetical protein
MNWKRFGRKRHGLIWRNIPVFAWWDWGKPQQSMSGEGYRIQYRSSKWKWFTNYDIRDIEHW